MICSTWQLLFVAALLCVGTHRTIGWHNSFLPALSRYGLQPQLTTATTVKTNVLLMSPTTSIAISDDPTALLDNAVVSNLLQKLTPVGDVIDALDLANDAADALSAEGIPDEQIVVGFVVLAAAAAVGWVMYQQTNSNRDESSSPDDIFVEEDRTTPEKAVLDSDTVEKLRDELENERSCRATMEDKLNKADDKLKAAMATNNELSQQCQDLQQQVTELTEGNELLSSQLNEREREFEIETNSMRRLSSKLVQLPLKRIGKRLKR